MSDWVEGLSPSERAEWDRFVQHQREHTVQAMAESAYVASLYPDGGNFDVKYAVELGMALMLDKPIILIVQPGAVIPARLRKVADAVIEADLDTERGRAHVARQLRAITRKL